jgi:hypothetical protein
LRVSAAGELQPDARWGATPDLVTGRRHTFVTADQHRYRVLPLRRLLLHRPARHRERKRERGR